MTRGMRSLIAQRAVSREGVGWGAWLPRGGRPLRTRRGWAPSDCRAHGHGWRERVPRTPPHALPAHGDQAVRERMPRVSRRMMPTLATVRRRGRGGGGVPRGLPKPVSRRLSSDVSQPDGAQPQTIPAAVTLVVSGAPLGTPPPPRPRRRTRRQTLVGCQ
jgi:hypothetical protein